MLTAEMAALQTLRSVSVGTPVLLLQDGHRILQPYPPTKGTCISPKACMRKSTLQCSRTSTEGRLCSRQVVVCRVPHELLVHGKPEGWLDAQTALHVPHSQLHPAHEQARSGCRCAYGTMRQLTFQDRPLLPLY